MADKGVLTVIFTSGMGVTLSEEQADVRSIMQKMHSERIFFMIWLIRVVVALKNMLLTTIVVSSYTMRV